MHQTKTLYCGFFPFQDKSSNVKLAEIQGKEKLIMQNGFREITRNLNTFIHRVELFDLQKKLRDQKQAGLDFPFYLHLFLSNRHLGGSTESCEWQKYDIYCQIIHRYAEAHPPTATRGLKI